MHDAGGDVVAPAVVVNAERLSRPARDVLAEAQAAARHCHHAKVDAPHVLLGILRRPDCKGGAALRRAGLTEHDVLARVRDRYVRGRDVPAMPLALTADAEALLDGALREAQSLEDEFIETVHLALACGGRDLPPSMAPFVAGRERAIREAALQVVRQDAEAQTRPRAASTRRERLEALQRAHDVRLLRARLKADFTHGRLSPRSVLLDPPDSMRGMLVLDVLLVVPGCTRARAVGLMARCAISPTATISELTEQQRRRLIDLL